MRRSNPGGCYKEVITQAEIDALMLDPDAVTAGTEICRGEAVYGGLDFDSGDRVALLLVNSTVPFADGDRTAVTVSAFGVGLLREGPEGSLRQPGVDGDMPSAPANVGELERMVREAGRERP